MMMPQSTVVIGLEDGVRIFFKIMGALIMALCLGQAQAQGELEGLYQKLRVMAEAGDAEAQYHVGMFLNNGIGTERNFKQAFAWFETSAKAGNALAAYKVGCYLAGQWGPIVTLDKDKALAFKLEAAKRGYSLAQNDVGNMYMQSQMPDEARRWWLVAGQQGLANPLYNLSVSYLQGQHEALDRVRGYAFFKLSKLLSEKHISEQAQASLNAIRESMTDDQFKLAEKMVEDWRVERSPLTLEASQGLQRAKTLAQQR